MAVDNLHDLPWRWTSSLWPNTRERQHIGWVGFDRMQVVDTPGVLGLRSRKNAAASEALVAVGSAAHVILIVLDLTESCGYLLADQEALLERWTRE